MTTSLKPPMPYAGGKQAIAERIAALLPEHTHYVEPFAGALSVLLAKEPSPIETVNDLNEDLITFWRILRDQPDDLERACALTPHSRRELQIATDRAGADDLEKARRVWVRLTQARSASMRPNMGSGWRFIAGGTRTPLARYLQGYANRIAPAAERLRRVSLECRPALELIADYGQHNSVCMYLDPPYIGDTRHSERLYEHELGGIDDHQILLDAALQCRSAVLISGYDHPLYNHALADWERHEFITLAQTSERRTEIVWINREANHLFSNDSASARSTAEPQL